MRTNLQLFISMTLQFKFHMYTSFIIQQLYTSIVMFYVDKRKNPKDQDRLHRIIILTQGLLNDVTMPQENPRPEPFFYHIAPWH